MYIQMDNNDMKSFSILLDIRELKIKTMMRQHHKLIRRSLNRKTVTRC